MDCKRREEGLVLRFRWGGTHIHSLNLSPGQGESRSPWLVIEEIKNWQCYC
jgi:hypothetical protein